MRLEHERTQRIIPETIQLNQRFRLFGPRQTSDNSDAFETPILLALPTASPIKLTIIADKLAGITGVGNLRNFITPFNPGEGYTVTAEDYELGPHLSKLRLGEFEPLPHPEEYLCLTIATLGDDRMQNSILYNEPSYLEEFRPEILEMLRNIRLQLFFPTTRYEGKIRSDFLRDGDIGIMFFSPSDMRPLPFDGLYTVLPSETEKFFQTEGRFVLAEKEPKRVK